MNAIFVRSLSGSLLATLSDYSIALYLHDGLHVQPFVATGTGALVGAAAGFILSRYWVFKSRTRWQRQLLRYSMVNLLGLVGNTGGMLLMAWSTWPFLPSRLLVGGIVYVLVSYPLNRGFAFTQHE
jgi:putative flippase GtrA